MRAQSSDLPSHSSVGCRKLAWRLACLAVLALVANACAIRWSSPWPRIRLLEASLAPPNRCASEGAEPCSRDRDCRGARCVAVVASQAPAYGRDGGHTVRIGDAVLWMFGDTFTPAGMLSSTAAWSRLDSPLDLAEATDAAGLPVQFFPYTAGERQFNDAHAEVPSCCRKQAGCPEDEPYCHCPVGQDCAERIALWPGDGVAVSTDEARVYYEKFVVGAAPYDFRRVGVGLARIRRGDVTAARDLETDGEARLIFGPTEPGFARGVVSAEEPKSFYAYATVDRQGCAVDVVVARVEVRHMQDRASYEFWGGRSGWTKELSEAVPVLVKIPGGLGSVIWSDYLGGYLSAWNDICTGGRILIVRTAPRPEGPWSPALGIDLASLGATREAYYGLLHPEFGSGKNLLLTFYQPIGRFHGQIRAVQLTLQ